ncbi:MAG: hypothetical protein JMDDDDMK_01368 [Acidobacteria bacterium]|nr:hypothetical protein [Acidobacteriota bacterium]
MRVAIQESLERKRHDVLGRSQTFFHQDLHGFVARRDLLDAMQRLHALSDGSDLIRRNAVEHVGIRFDELINRGLPKFEIFGAGVFEESADCGGLPGFQRHFSFLDHAPHHLSGKTDAHLARHIVGVSVQRVFGVGVSGRDERRQPLRVVARHRVDPGHPRLLVVKVFVH